MPQTTRTASATLHTCYKTCAYGIQEREQRRNPCVREDPDQRHCVLARTCMGKGVGIVGTTAAVRPQWLAGRGRRMHVVAAVAWAG